MARDTKNRSSGKAGAANKAATAQPAPPARKRSTSPLKFFSEVRQEGRKVTWTSRNETLVSTIMVVVMGKKMWSRSTRPSLNVAVSAFRACLQRVARPMLRTSCST